MCAAFESKDSKSTDFTFGFGTADDANSLFQSFSENLGIVNGTLQGAIGAISVLSSVPGTLSITFGWHFPARDHYGQVVGNQYAAYYADAADAALGNVHPGTRSAALASIVRSFSDMHDVFYKSSLPLWLSSQLVNSVSHIRTAMWFAKLHPLPQE